MLSVRLLIWAAVAGSFIPVMAILNGRLGRSIGQSLHAPVILFAVGLIFCVICSYTFTKSLPTFETMKSAQPVEHVGGLIVAFYVTSATLLAPRIGVANFIICAVAAQIAFSLAIDHFGLFGAAVRVVSIQKMLGVGLLIIGLFVSQMADLTGEIE